MSKQATCGSFGLRSNSARIGARLCGWCSGASGTYFSSAGDDGRIQAHGLRVFEPAVHDAMADTDEAMVGEGGAHEGDQVIERAFVAELGAFTPRLFIQHGPSRILGDEAGRRIKPLGLPAGGELQRIATCGEERELEARRARVQHGDDVAHVGARAAARSTL